jgi:hypothetical protein
MIVISVLLLFSVGQAQTLSPENKFSPDKLVQNLGHASYLERSQAQRRLQELVAQKSSKTEALAALRRCTKSADLEIRESALRILREAEHQSVQLEIEKLLDLTNPSSKINLPLWSQYSAMAEQDIDSRLLFAKLATDHLIALRYLSHCYQDNAKPKAPQKRTASDLVQVHHLLDPYSIASDDAALWALLLCVDDPRFRLGLGGLSTRTTLALTQTGTGPVLPSRRESAVVKRMIGKWVAKDRGTGLDRERLAIAMKYQCHQEASFLCDQVLQDRFATPSSHAMALLCASTLGRPHVEHLLIERVSDHRTAHVWQLIASRKTKIRTQVSDVAVALMLHQQGIDPRKAGFAELQADPFVVFREHSLGFSSESERQDAYTKAWKLLGIEMPELN